MSANKLINAVIALVEDRSKDAREMLRSPELNLPIGEVQGRLFIALDKRAKLSKIEVLKDVLRTTLRIDVDRKTRTPEEREAYISGIAEVEQILENYIGELTAEVLPGPNTPSQV